MSRQNSDLDIFDSDNTGGNLAPLSSPNAPALADDRRAAKIAGPVGKRPFDVYSFSLIISFILFVAAAILLFVNAGKY